MCTELWPVKFSRDIPTAHSFLADSTGLVHPEWEIRTIGSISHVGVTLALSLLLSAHESTCAVCLFFCFCVFPPSMALYHIRADGMWEEDVPRSAMRELQSRVASCAPRRMWAAAALPWPGEPQTASYSHTGRSSGKWRVPRA
jgi:hypothetical protein